MSSCWTCERNTLTVAAGKAIGFEAGVSISLGLAVPDTWLGCLQALGRVQQFFLGTPSPNDVLPGADTQQVDFGFNYYLPLNLCFNAGYGRQFSSFGNSNVWNIQVTYRFLFPLLPGWLQVNPANRVWHGSDLRVYGRDCSRRSRLLGATSGRQTKACFSLICKQSERGRRTPFSDAVPPLPRSA